MNEFEEYYTFILTVDSGIIRPELVRVKNEEVSKILSDTDEEISPRFKSTDDVLSWVSEDINIKILYHDMVSLVDKWREMDMTICGKLEKLNIDIVKGLLKLVRDLDSSVFTSNIEHMLPKEMLFKGDLILDKKRKYKSTITICDDK